MLKKILLLSFLFGNHRHFTQSIQCPHFQANHVHLTKSGDTYKVEYMDNPNYTQYVNDTSCVVSQEY